MKLTTLQGNFILASLRWTRYNVDTRVGHKRKKEKKMENVIQVYFTSDCCGADMAFAQTDYGICPECCEHCEVMSDEIVEDNGEF